MTIQERLKAMKQREAAAILDVSRPFVAQLIKGVRSPSIATVVKAADRLKCSDEEIVASVRKWLADAARQPTATAAQTDAA